MAASKHTSRSKFMIGSPVLMGDNTIPGLQLPKELKELLPQIFQAVTDFGCEYYPTVVEKLTYDEISEIAAYDGFPVRYPHWKFGMEYEEMQRRYEHGMHRIFEMVVNTNPCYIYCLDSNTLVDDVTVVAHALGHCDFFKNNIYFSPTSQNMMNELANHGTRIRRYMSRWGKETVTEFLNHVLRIETLIDSAKAWERKKVKNPIVKDHRDYKHPGRLKAHEGHDYMEDYVNPQEWIDEQHERIERLEVAQQLDLFTEPTKDIMGFLRDHAPLKPWQSDIMAMLYKETIYFAPQRTTKMLNEGWASYVDYNIIAVQGMASLGQETDSSGIIDYSRHKMSVLGGKYSLNPYKLGFCLLMDIEERWNKGQFGQEWDECTDMKKRKDWDKKLGLGREKVFEVRKYYNDVTALVEFFTPDFCEKYEFFEWKKYPNGEVKIETRDPKKIKKKLLKQRINGGLPEIMLLDPNHKGNDVMFLEHTWDGITLYPPYAKAVLQSLHHIWKKDVLLATRNKDGKEFLYVCTGEEDGEITAIAAEEYMKE